MAMAGRLMARRMRGRGHSPAASGVYLVGRHLRRPRRYRRSQRAGCALSRRAVSMPAESTARLPLHPAYLRLMFFAAACSLVFVLFLLSSFFTTRVSFCM